MDPASNESERQLRIIFDNTGTSNSIFDTDCRLVRQNAESVAQLGIPDAQARHLHVTELFGEGRGAVIEARMHRVLATGVSESHDTEFVLATGRKTFRSSYQPLLDGEAVVGVQIISQDITEQVRAQEALRENELQFRTFFELAADLVCIAGFDSVFRKINPAGQALLGYDEQTLLSRPFTEFILPEDRELTQQVIADDLVSGRTVIQFENRYVRADGSILHLEWVSRPDTARGLVYAVARDVTARNRMRAEQTALEEQVRRSQKLESLGILAGGIAHDFNNLLAAVLGFIELANLKADDEKQHRYLDRAIEGCRKAQGLTKQLLTFAKGGAPVLRPHNPGDLVENLVQFASHGTTAKVSVDIEPGLPAIACDPEQLGQVISNLVINALQALDGQGSLAVSVKAEGADVVCRFVDTGPGIVPELLERIFDPFFTTKVEGSGLGLSICHSIVHKHGGSLTVDSVLGRGATFTLRLPAASGLAATESSPGTVEFRGSGRALVLDDQQEIRDAVGEILSQLGYEVAAVGTSWELEAAWGASARSPSLALLDLTLPGDKGGAECAAELRAQGYRGHLLAMSGYSENPVLSRPADFGFDAALAKPFTLHSLVALLKTLPRHSAILWE